MPLPFEFLVGKQFRHLRSSSKALWNLLVKESSVSEEFIILIIGDETNQEKNTCLSCAQKIVLKNKRIFRSLPKLLFALSRGNGKDVQRAFEIFLSDDLPRS